MQPVKFYGTGFSDSTEFVITWNLGNTCNYKCEYCPSYLNDGSVPWNDIERIKTILLQIKENFNPRPIRIEFVGGEVTLKNDFIDLVKFCKEQGFSVLIVTNASRTIRYWEEIAPYLNVAVLSFHPHFANKENYQSVIEVLQSNNVSVNCQLAMTKEHFWDLVEYKKILTEKFTNIFVDYAVLYDKERKFNNPYGYFYEYDQNQLDCLSKSGESTFTVEYDNGEIIEHSINDVRMLGLNKLSGFSCGTHLDTLAVDYRGGASISVCPQRSPVNIFKHDVAEIFKPKICEQDECRNPSDLRIFKVRDR